MKTPERSTPLQLGLFSAPAPAGPGEPAPMSDAAYFKALADARDNRRDPQQVERLLRDQVGGGRITQGDAAVIWRGVYWVWDTPFDSAGYPGLRANIHEEQNER